MRAVLRELHGKGNRSFWQMNAYLVLFFLLMAISIVSWQAGYWPITILSMALHAHVSHMNLIAFHEAAHFTLSRNRLLNEINGTFVGTFIWTPLSIFRWVHNRHHTYLATENDTELWPFVNPGTPRWARILAAIGELCFGFFYTPVVFLHGFLTAERMPRATRLRICGEYALCFLWWGGLVSAVTYFAVWPEFLVGYFLPAVLAGNLQSIRKFTEHMGMLGSDVESTTRTVVDPRPLGEWLSRSMMRIDYHGAHHKYGKIPQHRLPEATRILFDSPESQGSFYRSYAAAMWDMFRSLGNPRVGSQWLEEEARRTMAPKKPRSRRASQQATR